MENREKSKKDKKNKSEKNRKEFTMRYKHFKNADVKVSCLAVGTWAIGGKNYGTGGSGGFHPRNPQNGGFGSQPD